MVRRTPWQRWSRPAVGLAAVGLVAAGFGLLQLREPAAAPSSAGTPRETSGATSGAEPVTAPGTAVRVMPLGDSITSQPGCWRAMLWHDLRSTGHTDVTFVGTYSDRGACHYGYAYPQAHQGRGGYSATGIVEKDQLPGWLAADRPDIVLMHLGTNDFWQRHLPLPTVLHSFGVLVAQMRAANPDVTVLVAQIIPTSATACPSCPAAIRELNAALPGWAAGLTTARSPIVLVDQWTGFDPGTDTVDGIHPNERGFRKLADRWYPALAAALDRFPRRGSPSATTSVGR